MVQAARVRRLNQKPIRPGPILYWMSRDMRSRDNWALLYAQELAQERKEPLLVVYNLVPSYLGGGLRQFRFKIEGLRELEHELATNHIPFLVTNEDIQKDLPAIVKRYHIGGVITDFDCLRLQRQWRDSLSDRLPVAFFEADAHNVIPCWLVSPKREFAAYTIRPKIHRRLPEFLDEFPALQKHPFTLRFSLGTNDWEKMEKASPLNRTVMPVSWIKSGESAARAMLKSFIEARLKLYDTGRNDPNKSAVSDLSPYLHYGQLAAQRVALEIQRCPGSERAKEAFLEELIVRKELSDNFCFYTPTYDTFEGFPDWARRTLDEHRSDRREYLYSREEFESGQTHDDLWNAAQLEMVQRGKMHGYMRMYWAKKILEWSKIPEEALAVAIYLNDRYELDGRDPNGYTGIAWSIGGVHDRAWFERPIFGKIRYMSYNGCKSKFDVDAYKQYVASI